MVKHVNFQSCANAAVDSPAHEKEDTAGRRQSRTYSNGADSCASDGDLEACFFPYLEEVDDAGVPTSLLSLVASTLESNIAKNEMQDQLGTVGGEHMLPTGRLTPFHGLRQPPINIPDYLERISRYTKVSPSCFVVALALIDTLSLRNEMMRPISLNVHRLVITSVLLAAKFVDDRVYNNIFFAKVGGIPVAELNALELEMLKALEYRLLVPPHALRWYLRQLQAGVLCLGGDSGGLLAHSGGRKRRSASGTASEHRRAPAHRRSSMDSVGDALARTNSGWCGAASEVDFEVESGVSPGRELEMEA